MYLWWKLQASLIFLSGRTCTIVGWLNIFFAPLYTQLVFKGIAFKLFILGQTFHNNLGEFWPSPPERAGVTKLTKLKCIPSDYLMKLVERMPKLSSRQRVATLKNLKYKIYFDWFNTFLVTTWFHMCHFIGVTSSLLFNNVVNSKKYRCVQIFDWYCM